MTRRFALLVMVLALLLAGCGPPWQVVKQANPNPMVGKTSFVVKPIDFTGLRVGEKSEAEYLAEKDDETKGKWLGDKKGMNDEFVKSLTSDAAELGISVAPGESGDFILEPKIAWLEGGFYAYAAAKASEVQMTLTITDAAGNPIDQITLKHSTGASMTNPAVGNRLRDDTEAIGEYVAEYLHSRVNPGGG